MNIGLIFAGGVGSRMHSKDLPKQFLRIYDRPIIVHTIEHFEKNTLIDAVVVVCVAEWIDYFKKLADQYHLTKIAKIVPGGATGQLSIYNGLLAAKEIAKEEKSIVLIHDGVRPLINSDLLTQNIECVQKHGSSITSGIVKETIVEIDDNGAIKLVPDRAHSRVAKAPQCFWLNDILAAHERIRARPEGYCDMVDQATIFWTLGIPIHLVPGNRGNVKITTREDIIMLDALLRDRALNV